MLDRSIDLISPFCQQQTYEGQIDETFGINTTLVEIKSEILSSSFKPEAGKPTSEVKRLTNEDIIFKQIRSKAYEALGFFFKEKVQEFEDATDKSKNTTKDLVALTESVNRIKEMNIPIVKPLCDMHNNICYYIKKLNTEKIDNR